MKKCLVLVVLFILHHHSIDSIPTNATSEFFFLSTTDDQNNVTFEGDKQADEHVSIHVASWRWDYVRTPLILTLFILMAGILKIVFHHADKLSSILPESCLLILLGVIVGSVTKSLSPSIIPHFTAYTFFLFLLPPIVLEASYSLHNRAFLRNVGTVLLFAVIGTLFNCFVIGLSLFGLGNLEYGMLKLSIIEAFVFSALISAVDPVAVLAIFQEVGVNKDLYFLVFGESLLNDAVTVVLYTMMETFTKMSNVSPEQYGLGLAAFLTVSLGGLSIGVIFGILTSLLTKFTDKVRVVEPLAFLGLAYFSYVGAELFHFSGIISIIGCGLVQAHYAKRNISTKSCTTIKYFTKMLSSICDSIIFLFLGMVLVETQHKWHTGFALTTVALCLLSRFVGVYLLTALANMFRQKRINFEEQFIMAYGGLRGAVSFSLVLLLDEDSVEHKQIFVTTTLVMVIFTVFIQGITIKPLVKLLRIRTKKTESPSLLEEINNKVATHLMAGVEEISGSLGDFYFKERCQHFNNKYIKPFLIRSSSISGNLNRIYEKLSLADHYANLYGPNICLEDKKPLIQSIDKDTDIDNVVSSMVAPGPAVDFNPEVSDLEVELRQSGSGWKTVRDHFSRSISYPNSGTENQIRTNVRRRKDHALLKRALSNSPYEKLHYQYNKNLVDDDDQEISFHLKRRCTNAKRLTSMILSPPFKDDSSDQHLPSTSVFGSPSLPPGSRLDIYDATQMLLDRARLSRTNARCRSKSDCASLPSVKPLCSRTISLNDASSRNHRQHLPFDVQDGLRPVTEDKSELTEYVETQM